MLGEAYSNGETEVRETITTVGKEGKGKCWAFPSVPCEFMLWSADAASLPADMPPSLVPASNKDILRRKIISLETSQTGGSGLVNVI